MSKLEKELKDFLDENPIEKQQLEDSYKGLLHLQQELSFAGDDEIGEQIFQFMKDIDYYAFTLEITASYLLAREYYKIALGYMELYAQSEGAEDVERHLGTCHLVIARASLALNDEKPFEEHFKRFVNYSISSFRVGSIEYEAKYLREISRELFEKARFVNKELFKELILYARLCYLKEFSKNEIDVGILTSLELNEAYLLITYNIGLSEKLFSKHVEALKKLITHYGQKKALFMAYEQFFTLIYASYVPSTYKLIYSEYRDLLLVKTKTKDSIIRVFISSVFSDFQEERDLIQSIVLPEMKAFCLEKYGLEFEIIDLRWGIELSPYLSEEEAMYKILSVCNEMIENAKPYFFLFASNEYGTEVEPRLLSQLYPYLNISSQTSITEVEYLLRVSDETNPSGIFLFQKNKEEITHDKVLSLLERVKKQIPSENVLDYTLNENNLAEMIISSLKENIEQNHNEKDNFNSVDYQLERTGLNMVGFDEQKENLLRLLKLKHSPVFVIQSQSGGGKTTFLANTFLELKKLNYITFPFFAKNLKSYVNEEQFLQFVRTSIESVLEIETTKESTLKESILAIRELSQKLTPDQHIIFLVDDFDQIIYFNEPFSWQNHQLQNITFILSLKNSELMVRLLSQGAVPIQLTNIEKDFDLFVATKLMQNHKKISHDIAHRLYLKFSVYKAPFNPLYLNTLIQHLVYISEENYQEIKNSLIKFPISFNQAIDNHQNGLIHLFPNSLEKFAKEKITRLIEEDDMNEYLLAMLAFQGNEGINLTCANEILERANLERHFTSFLKIKYALKDLIEMENTTYLKCTKDFFIESIFQTINPEVLTRVAFVFGYKSPRWVSLICHLKALVYVQKDDSLAKLYISLNEEQKAYLLHAMFFHPDGEDHGLKFLQEVEKFSEPTFILMWALLESFLHSSHKFISRKEEYAAVISKRLSLIAPYRDTHLIKDLYALASAKLLRNVDQDKFQYTFLEHHQYILEHFEAFNIESTYVLDYFFALFERAKNMNVYHHYYELFLDQFGPTFADHEFRHKDSYLMSLKLLHIIYSRISEGERAYLEQFEKSLNEHYGITITKDSYQDHIDFLFYLAVIFTEIGESQRAVKYYEAISVFFYEDDILFPSTSKNIKMLSTVRNNLGASYMRTLMNLYYQRKEDFANKPDALISLLDATSILLKHSCLAAQNMANGEPNELNHANYFTSNLNLTIYLMMFTNKYDEAFGFITDATVRCLTLIRNGYVLPTSFIFNILYTQMYMDYVKMPAINNLKALDFFVSEVEKLGPNFRMPDVDFNHVYHMTNQQLMLFKMEKSPTYLELEDKINAYFKNK